MSLKKEKNPSNNAKTDKELEVEINNAEVDEKELEAVAGGWGGGDCQFTEDGCMGVW